MRFEKCSKTLYMALFALVVLSLGTNVLLYLQVQQLKEQGNFLRTTLAEVEEDVANLTLQVLQIRTFTSKTIHTRTLWWEPQSILHHDRIEGYVGNWTVQEAVRIIHIEVWMGNPYDILWEGDTFVMLNNTVNPWHPPSDTVLVHYQFDSHDKSPVPHQKSFDLRPGFQVGAGETLYVYRLFVNFDEETTYAGDGWVMFYYTSE